MNYDDFLRSKIKLSEKDGFDCDQSEVSPILKPHQKDAVVWAVRGGKRGIFASFGLGKSVMQIETLRLILAKDGGGSALIIAPLGVRQEFVRDAKMVGVRVKFIRAAEEMDGDGIYITNYESVRDGKLDVSVFTAVSLDEASVLRGFGGTKTFREFMAILAGDRKTMNERTITDGVRYRFVATATPSPNDYIELLAYAAFLGVMDVGQAKTRFFKRNSEKADQLTLLPHKEDEFWLWVASWGLFISKPSDLGHADDGYSLPDMGVRWHETHSSVLAFETDKSGQGILFKDAAAGLVEAAREKRDSVDDRVRKMKEIVAEYGDDQIVIWVDLNYEQQSVEKTLKDMGITYASLYGNQSIEERETLLEEWRDRKRRVFLSKPMMYGSGVNLQQCHRMIFLGIGFKFNDFIQGVHRIYRFLQEHPVTIDIIYTEAEERVKQILLEKWHKHERTVQKMREIIQKYGLSKEAMASALERKLGVERVEVSGNHYRAVNSDCVQETSRMDDESVDMILTSIPFSTQYEYSPNYCDFGHCDTNDHFFQQMDYLTPNLFRVLKPGRIAAIHVKDRIVPGGLTGLGFQTVYPFHAETISHYTRHGFAFMGMITVVTDVVRENNQTYRLGWSEVCKDGTKISCGMPEYILLFRKPQTDSSKAYADVPVTHDKSEYSRARWQVDAHGFWRSSGDRHLLPEEFDGLEHSEIFQKFKKHYLENVYHYEDHVAVGEHLDERGKLPVTFMLLQPPSWMDDHVWTDVARMRTLNTLQGQKGKEQHLCPLQFDIVDRLIERFTNEGETVMDPFGGIMTVPYCAVKMGRKGIGIELNPSYFADGVHYLDAAEREANTPTLFDFMEQEDAETCEC